MAKNASPLKPAWMSKATGGKKSEMKKFPAKKSGMSGDKPGVRKALKGGK